MSGHAKKKPLWFVIWRAPDDAQPLPGRPRRIRCTPRLKSANAAAVEVARLTREGAVDVRILAP